MKDSVPEFRTGLTFSYVPLVPKSLGIKSGTDGDTWRFSRGIALSVAVVPANTGALTDPAVAIAPAALGPSGGDSQVPPRGRTDCGGARGQEARWGRGVHSLHGEGEGGVERLVGGPESGTANQGAGAIPEVRKKPEFMRVISAGHKVSLPHCYQRVL